MSVRRWPDKCAGPSTTGYGMQPIDPTLRTAMEAGAQRARRRSFARLDRIKMQWVMSPLQYAAFSAWYYGAKVSIAGASDSLSGWFLWNVTRSAGASVSPEGILVDRLLETAVIDQHHIIELLPSATFDNLSLLVRATIRPAGRIRVRLAVWDRSGAESQVTVNLTTGAVIGSWNPISYAVEDRGTGWWRITLVASTGTGAATPSMRVRIFDDVGTVSYLGDPAKGIDVCEMQARVVTGYDLFVPADDNGAALGADGGSSWFFTYVPTEAGLQWKEVRFTAPFSEEIRPGLNRIISGEMEVRYV